MSLKLELHIFMHLVDVILWVIKLRSYDQTIHDIKYIRDIKLQKYENKKIKICGEYSIPLPLSVHSCVCDRIINVLSVRRMSSCPVFLQPGTEVVGGLLQRVLVEDYIPHLEKGIVQIWMVYIKDANLNNINCHIPELLLN